MSILTKNWHIWYFGGVDSESRPQNSDPKTHFWANLGPKIWSCPFCLKIGAWNISRMLIPNPDLDFWNFDPKINFWANLGPKTQSCQFCLKIGTHGISRMLILIPTLVSWISNRNFLFRNFLGSADFESGLRFSKFRLQNPFLGKFGPKKSKLSVFPENWYAWHLDDADSYSKISFLNFWP